MIIIESTDPNYVLTNNITLITDRDSEITFYKGELISVFNYEENLLIGDIEAEDKLVLNTGNIATKFFENITPINIKYNNDEVEYDLLESGDKIKFLKESNLKILDNSLIYTVMGIQNDDSLEYFNINDIGEEDGN